MGVDQHFFVQDKTDYFNSIAYFRGDRIIMNWSEKLWRKKNNVSPEMNYIACVLMDLTIEDVENMNDEVVEHIEKSFGPDFVSRIKEMINSGCKLFFYEDR